MSSLHPVSTISTVRSQVASSAVAGIELIPTKELIERKNAKALRGDFREAIFFIPLR
jgi:hypothetical protein